LIFAADKSWSNCKHSLPFTAYQALAPPGLAALRVAARRAREPRAGGSKRGWNMWGEKTGCNEFWVAFLLS